jgi:hypothetical protein
VGYILLYLFSSNEYSALICAVSLAAPRVPDVPVDVSGAGIEPDLMMWGASVNGPVGCEAEGIGVGVVVAVVEGAADGERRCKVAR